MGAAPGKLIGVRLSQEALHELDDWIAKHARHASRPEAIRALIELGIRRGQPAG